MVFVRSHGTMQNNMEEFSNSHKHTSLPTQVDSFKFESFTSSLKQDKAPTIVSISASCLVCHREFPDEKSLKQHLGSHKPGELMKFYSREDNGRSRLKYCSDCYQYLEFSNDFELRKHKFEVHYRKNFLYCSVCYFSTGSTNKTRMPKHQEFSGHSGLISLNDDNRNNTLVVKDSNGGCKKRAQKAGLGTQQGHNKKGCKKGSGHLAERQNTQQGETNSVGWPTRSDHLAEKVITQHRDNDKRKVKMKRQKFFEERNGLLTEKAGDELERNTKMKKRKFSEESLKNLPLVDKINCLSDFIRVEKRNLKANFRKRSSHKISKPTANIHLEKDVVVKSHLNIIRKNKETYIKDPLSGKQFSVEETEKTSPLSRRLDNVKGPEETEISSGLSSRVDDIDEKEETEMNSSLSSRLQNINADFISIRCLSCKTLISHRLYPYHIWYHHIMNKDIFNTLQSICRVCGCTDLNSRDSYRQHMRDHFLDPQCKLVVNIVDRPENCRISSIKSSLQMEEGFICSIKSDFDAGTTKLEKSVKMLLHDIKVNSNIAGGMHDLKLNEVLLKTAQITLYESGSVIVVQNGLISVFERESIALLTDITVRIFENGSMVVLERTKGNTFEMNKNVLGESCGNNAEETTLPKSTVHDESMINSKIEKEQNKICVQGFKAIGLDKKGDMNSKISGNIAGKDNTDMLTKRTSDAIVCDQQLQIIRKGNLDGVEREVTSNIIVEVGKEAISNNIVEADTEALSNNIVQGEKEAIRNKVVEIKKEAISNNILKTISNNVLDIDKEAASNSIMEIEKEGTSGIEAEVEKEAISDKRAEVESEAIGNVERSGCTNDLTLMVDLNVESLSGKLKFKCDICEKSKPSTQINVTGFFTHLRYYHHGDKDGYCCKMCGKMFIDLVSLFQHSTRQHGLNCINNYGQLSENDLLQRIPNGEPHSIEKQNNKCRFCEKYFYSTAILQQHEELHKMSVKTGKRGKMHFACKTCNKMFESVSGLKHHIRRMKHEYISFPKKKIRYTKRDDRFEDQYICYYCGENSARNTCSVCHSKCRKLSRFKSSRYGTFRCCIECNRRFYSKQKLDEHKCREKIHVCHSCGKQFKRRNNFLSHLRSHKQKRIACAYCDKLFRQRASVASHEKIYHNIGNGILCDRCGILVKYRQVFVYHRKTCNYV